MMETFITSSLLAITLAATFNAIVHARQAVSHSAHRATATSLAVAKLDELMASDQVVLGTQIDSLPSYPTSFSMEWEVTQSGLESQSTPALTNADVLHQVRVLVRYPSQSGTKEVEYYALRKDIP